MISSSTICSLFFTHFKFLHLFLLHLWKLNKFPTDPRRPGEKKFDSMYIIVFTLLSNCCLIIGQQGII